MTLIANVQLLWGKLTEAYFQIFPLPSLSFNPYMFANS